MPFPPHIRTKYLNRFDELIQRGQEIHDSIKIIPRESYITRNQSNPFRESPRNQNVRTYEDIDQSALTQWNIHYQSLLEQIIPLNSVQRKLVDLKNSYSIKSHLSERIAALKAIKEQFEHGFLEDIALQIELEIASDYMGQAEKLLSEGQSGKFDHVPAAVLSGAILEKTLRSLCDKQTPPVPTINGNGKPHTLNLLIDEMKKAGIFNELKAKQLRALADIRNAAAHGEFDKFTRSDVEQMIKGINDFLTAYMT
jgi:Domain of unknown function (DUF4145)